MKEQCRYALMGVTGRERRPDTQRKGRMDRQDRCGVRAKGAVEVSMR